MASEGDEADRATAVASVASRLFGTAIPRRRGDRREPCARHRPGAQACNARRRARGRDRRRASRDSWTTMRFERTRWRSGSSSRSGSQTGSGCRGASPPPSRKLPSAWPTQTGRDEARCRAQLQTLLILMSRPAKRARRHRRSGIHGLQAASVHFRRGPRLRDAAFSARSGGSRSTANASTPDDPEARLYATFFCRNCGQEHHPVVLVEERRGRARPAARHRRNAAG